VAVVTTLYGQSHSNAMYVDPLMTAGQVPVKLFEFNELTNDWCS